MLTLFYINLNTGSNFCGLHQNRLIGGPLMNKSPIYMSHYPLMDVLVKFLLHPPDLYSSPTLPSYVIERGLDNAAHVDALICMLLLQTPP